MGVNGVKKIRKERNVIISYEPLPSSSPPPPSSITIYEVQHCRKACAVFFSVDQRLVKT